MRLREGKSFLFIVTDESLHDFGESVRIEAITLKSAKKSLIERHKSEYSKVLVKREVLKVYELLATIRLVGSVANSQDSSTCDCGSTEGVELLIVRDSVTDVYLYSSNLCTSCQEELKQDGYGLENC